MKEKSKKNKETKSAPAASKKKAVVENNSLILGILAAMLLVTVVVFFPMLKNQFTSWDDGEYITNNSRIWKLNAENIKFIFTQPIAGNYHPFTMLSLAFNYSFSKLNPSSYYIVNLLIHLLNTLLVYRFVYLLSNKNNHVALFGALIFAIHPMHVESVAWATERKDMLYTLFYLPALIYWILYIDTQKRMYYIASFVFTICAMFSKPAAIILPGILILIDYYRLEKFEIKSQLNKIPFFIVAAFFMYMTLIAQSSDHAIIGDFKKYSFIERIFFAGYGFLVYIVKLFIPVHLATFHPYPKVLGILEYGAPVVIALFAIAIYFLKEKRKLLVFGMLFYLVNLVLVLQFFSIGEALYAERYTYVPYIGLCFILGMILFDAKVKANVRFIWTGIGLFSVFLAYATNERVKVWHNDETLWTDMIVKYPDLDRGYYDRGNYYSAKGETDKAIADFSNAIQRGTDYRAYTNRGVIYLKLLRYDEALKDFVDAIKLKPRQDEAFLGRAHVYFELKKYEEALQDANAAVAFKPSYDALFFRGLVYKTMGRYNEAIADYTAAAAKTTEVIVFNNRGNVYFQLQNYAAAIADYNMVLRGNPQDANTLSNRGAAYYLNNQLDEAIADINKSLSLDPNNQRNYSNLALIYEKKGDPKKALEYAEKAMKLGATFPGDFLNKLRK